MYTEDILSKICTYNQTNDLTSCVVDSMKGISLKPFEVRDYDVEKCIEIICEKEVEFCEVNTREQRPPP